MLLVLILKELRKIAAEDQAYKHLMALVYVFLSATLLLTLPQLVLVFT